MKVKIFLILGLAILFISSVSAIDTNVVIKTIPGYKAQISFLNPGYSYSLIESFHYTANNDGEIKFVFSTTKSEFDVKIWLSLDGVAILNKKFDETFTAGEDLVLELYPGWYTQSQPTTNTTNTTTTNSNTLNETTPANATLATTSGTSTSTEEVNETNNTIFSDLVESKKEKPKKERQFTAFSIQDGKISLNPKIIYYALGLVVIAIIIFVSVRGIKKSEDKEGKGIKVTKLSDFHKSRQETVEQEEKRLAAAKRKIEEAETELRKMRNEDKILQMQKKIEEDQKELARLRSGR